MQPLRDNARILVASAAGTAVEYYDFFLYGTAAALVFGPLFFPAQSAAAQTLYAFMSFGIAFLARPIGAVAFGHFGDRVGRKSTLVASLLLMGAATLLIAFLPTYHMIGWTAPLLLCVLRFCQGFGLGGEWGGAALLVVENAPKGWETRFVSIMQLGSPVGFIAATGVIMLLSLSLDNSAFMSWGWRVPFVASAALVLLGLWVRFNIGETEAFRLALARDKPERGAAGQSADRAWAGRGRGRGGGRRDFRHLLSCHDLCAGAGHGAGRLFTQRIPRHANPLGAFLRGWPSACGHRRPTAARPHGYSPMDRWQWPSPGWFSGQGSIPAPYRSRARRCAWRCWRSASPTARSAPGSHRCSRCVCAIAGCRSPSASAASSVAR
jgi:MFS family permease